MTYTLPAPRSNLTGTGVRDRGTDVATAATTKVVVGDFTGGVAEDMFTLTAHGLTEGTTVHVLWQSEMGAITGGEGTRCLVHKLTANTFQVTDTGGTTIENTVDGTVVFLAGDISTAMVELGVIPNIIVGTHDFTGGAAEDIDTPAQGTKGLMEGDTIKLLYKSDAGVAAVAVDATVYAKAPTVTYFQTAATSGGAVQNTTVDGTNVWLKTS